ncbi:MAG: hypothetical protein RX318_03960 [bacterium]|nr:hypothetical protein [bacterium]
MRVRVLSGRYSGEVRVYPPEVAKILIADGRAERVDSSEADETASVAPPETAAVRTGRLTPRPVGGGWYMVGSKKVRGKQQAAQAAEELAASGVG